VAEKLMLLALDYFTKRSYTCAITR